VDEAVREAGRKDGEELLAIVDALHRRWLLFLWRCGQRH
jgi:hypothetical protein